MSTPTKTRTRKTGRPALYPQVQAQIKKMIKSQGFQSGGQLDSEAQLCRRFDVSRASVRKALQQLAIEGLVVSIPGKGHFVNNAKEGTPANGVILCVLGTHNPEALSNDSYVADIVGGLRSRLANSERRLLVEAVGTSQQPASNLIANHLQNLAGLIVVPLGEQTAEDMLASTPSNLPRVVVGRPSHKPDIPCVYINHHEALSRATQHLIDMGHENIAMLSISTTSTGWAGEQSAAGYKAAMRNAGLDENRLAFNNASNSPEANQQAIEQILRDHPDTTAMIIDIFQDFAALRKLESLNIKIPENLSLVLVDDTEAARHHNPPVTVIREPTFSMGQIGGDMLNELLAGRTPMPRSVEITVELIARDSVRPASRTIKSVNRNTTPKTDA